MIQPISGVNFNYQSRTNFKGKVPFVGFYDPACSGGRGPMPKDTFDVIADFAKKTTGMIKNAFVSEKTEQLSFESPVITGINRFKEKYLPEIAEISAIPDKVGVKFLDDRNFINNDSEIITHILPDGITAVNIDKTFDLVGSTSTIGEKVKSRFLDKFGIDLNNVPEWVDPTSKYLTDTDGKILFSSVSHEPYINPWYNPNSVVEKISAVSSLSRPSMDDFLAKSAGIDITSSAFDEVTGVFEKAGIKLEALMPEDELSVDDGLIDSLADKLKSLLEFLSDAV